MKEIEKFEDLEIFQSARELCKEIYNITKEEDYKNDVRFVQQIRASAGSIMDNIAEGFERNGNKEFINFLYIATGSCGEVRSQIIRASDVGFIDNATAKKIYESCISLSKSMACFIQKLKKSDLAGPKYK